MSLAAADKMQSFSYINNNRYELTFATYVAKVTRVDNELAVVTVCDQAGNAINIPDSFEVRNNLTTALAARLGQQFILQWQHSYTFRYQDQILCRFNNQRQQSAFLGQYQGATHNTVVLP